MNNETISSALLHTLKTEKNKFNRQNYTNKVRLITLFFRQHNKLLNKRKYIYTKKLLLRILKEVILKPASKISGL